MKTTFKFLGLCTIALLLANWATPSLDKTSFFGKVTTRQGNVLNLTNIKVGRDRHYAINKQIPVYEKPTNPAKPTTLSGSSNQEIVMTADPETQLFRKFIDLNEIKKVSIPEPEIIWTFKKEKQYAKLEYIEVIIDRPDSEEHYLIDRRMKLYGDAVQDIKDAAGPVKGPEETEVPLQGIQTITLEGYYLKEANGTATQMPTCAVSEE